LRSGTNAGNAGFGVLYRKAHLLFEEIALATLSGTRHDCMHTLAEIPLLIVDDLGMRKPPVSVAEDLRCGVQIDSLTNAAGWF